MGLVLLACGIVMGGWAFKLLGLKRSLCLNFFEENVPIVKHPLYKYVKNPEDYGFLTILFGFALFTRSFYNLIIAIEFMVLLIPHMKLENKPIKK
jgi:protein-S-isoprenylcysteine O-methyltransferase Ste14